MSHTHTLTISEKLHEQLVYVKQMLKEMTEGQDISDEELISLLLSAFAQSVTNDQGGGCCGGGCECGDKECGSDGCGCHEEFDEEAHHLKHTHKTAPTPIKKPAAAKPTTHKKK